MPKASKQPSVYILASGYNGTLYIGVTSGLVDRISIHKQDLVEGFTKLHGVHSLVYYGMFETMDEAIKREKQLKKWRRLWKFRLIEQMNPQRRDLFDEVDGIIAGGPGGQAEQQQRALCFIDSCLGSRLRGNDGVVDCDVG